MQLRAIVLSAVVAMVMFTPMIEAYSNGRHNSSGGCGCHGGSSPGVTISENFPSTYVAGQSYSIQVSVSGGVSGTAGGFNVQVDKGTLSTGGNSGVKVSGLSVTHSNKANRAWSFDWIAPSSGSGTVSVGIAGMSANGGSGNNGDAWSSITRTISETVVATNNPPVASNVQISPSAATSSDDVSLTYTFSDQDAGDTELGTTIQWSKNGVHEVQFDGQMTISGDETIRGEDWQASVTPSDGEDFGATVQSNTITIMNSLPSITSPTISPSNPTSADDLTASIFGANDVDGDALSFEYRWYLDGVLQGDLNDFNTVPSIATRSGDEWEVEARAFDGEGYSSWVRSSAFLIKNQNSNAAPTVESITISPINPNSSDSLAASSTYFDADMDPITDVQYRWWKNGVMTAISSSTLESSTTTKGDFWSVEVRVSDDTDWSAWASSPNVEILNSAPVIQAASISSTGATTTEDVVLNTSFSDIDDDTLTAVIDWYLDGALQPEYNNLASLPSSATNKGDVWTAVVQASDGETLSAQSETLTVAILNSKPLLSVHLDENITSQQDLSIESIMSDVDGDVTEISTVTWFRNGFREGSLDNATYVPSSYLGPGQEWSVEVVATDGESSVLSTASVFINNAPPVSQITVLTASLYAGERVMLSASQSTDSDNSIVRYQWILANEIQTGVDASFLLPASGSIEVSLAVTDESGATNTTNLTLDTIPALPCPSLTQTLSGGAVQLDWTWTSSTRPSFEVSRNGVVLGTTNETTFEDSPNLIGTSTYQIQTILDERILESPCQSPSADVEIESASIELDRGPSAIAGLGLGFVYVLVGILLLVSSLLRRGDEE